MSASDPIDPPSRRHLSLALLGVAYAHAGTSRRPPPSPPAASLPRTVRLIVHQWLPAPRPGRNLRPPGDLPTRGPRPSTRWSSPGVIARPRPEGRERGEGRASRAGGAAGRGPRAEGVPPVGLFGRGRGAGIALPPPPGALQKTSGARRVYGSRLPGRRASARDEDPEHDGVGGGSSVVWRPAPGRGRLRETSFSTPRWTFSPPPGGRGGVFLLESGGFRVTRSLPDSRPPLRRGSPRPRGPRGEGHAAATWRPQVRVEGQRQRRRGGRGPRSAFPRPGRAASVGSDPPLVLPPPDAS